MWRWFEVLKVRSFWDGFVYALSGPMMMAVPPPPLPAVELDLPPAPEISLESAWNQIGDALRFAMARFDEELPLAPAQAQIIRW